MISLYLFFFQRIERVLEERNIHYTFSAQRKTDFKKYFIYILIAVLIVSVVCILQYYVFLKRNTYLQLLLVLMVVFISYAYTLFVERKFFLKDDLLSNRARYSLEKTACCCALLGIDTKDKIRKFAKLFYEEEKRWNEWRKTVDSFSNVILSGSILPLLLHLNTSVEPSTMSFVFAMIIFYALSRLYKFHGYSRSLTTYERFIEIHQFYEYFISTKDNLNRIALFKEIIKGKSEDAIIEEPVKQ